MQVYTHIHPLEDFWTLKELEKMAPKMKGIGTFTNSATCAVFLCDVLCGFVVVVVGTTVKEILDSLVEDNIVTAEKIGTSNCKV
jgi:hypothetical protein